jgi:hypothetical protein
MVDTGGAPADVLPPPPPPPQALKVAATMAPPKIRWERMEVVDMDYLSKWLAGRGAERTITFHLATLCSPTHIETFHYI